MKRLFLICATVALVLLGATACDPPANVANLITHVDPARSVFHLHDTAGNTMDTLKVVQDPTTAGRYLGVYHTYNGSTYLSSIATSTDLRTWTFRRTFDTSASQPYLAFGPNNEPVIAVEAFTNAHLRFYYWSTVAGLLGIAAPVQQFDAARTLSSCAEGTPDIRGIGGGSTVATSTIFVGHHYFQNCQTDREALGGLQNFSTWSTAVKNDIDTAMTNAGAPGKHGDRDHFTVGGADYLLLEGSINSTPATFDFSKWRNYIYDGDTATELDPQTPGHSTAFANPSATVLNDPNGTPSLLVTQFIPSSGAGANESGELLYWNPLP